MKGYSDLPLIQGILRLKRSTELADWEWAYLITFKMESPFGKSVFSGREGYYDHTLHSHTCSEINVGFPTLV